MYPALDYTYFTNSTLLPREYGDGVRIQNPGWFEQRVTRWTERLYASLAKRYGAGFTASNIPFGNTAPPVTSQGTLPPGMTLSGVPTLGSILLQIQIQTPGPLGTATFVWSVDGGLTFTPTPIVAGVNILGSTGLVATFSNLSNYSSDNLYMAPTPIPSAILGWLVDLLNLDILRKRGFNPNDPQPQLIIEDAKRALEEVSQAANSKEGLFDLPVVDEAPSAIKSGGPLWYTEQSPYVGADLQQANGMPEDANGIGTFGGNGAYPPNAASGGPGGFPPNGSF